MTDDKFGDKIKAREQEEAGRKADSTKPLMARLDGRSFHTFTRGLNRPYDIALSSCMIDAMRHMVEETHATLGYVQSDEISLMWEPKQEASQHLFDGKYQKLCSVLSAICSVKFNSLLSIRLPAKADEAPVFDCRVWNVDTLEEAADVFVWRQADCVKNAVSMAAQAVFSHKLLQKRNTKEKIEMLRIEGVDFEKYPEFFKLGTYARRDSVIKTLSEAELMNIPEKFRPTGPVQRSEVHTFFLPSLRRVTNKVECLIHREEPIVNVQSS